MYRITKTYLPFLKRLYSTQVKRLTPTDSPVSQALKLNVGEKLFGYTVKQVEEVPELQLAAVLLNHEKTGAEHLHVARDDKNNVFSVSLRTTPRNSKGIMHILEHLALCGSQKYQCRDPFMKMNNRSLATFMNAYTGCDFTMYIFSSQNAKDFENLFRVYGDAVFFPLLREPDFRQEGWRLEHADIHDKSSPIVLKGVVFNEMKGVFSDTNQLYIRYLLNRIFPTTYCYESGGDPLEIPNLSLAELHQYHVEYYHPSNSRFFTYGDQPLESHLQLIEESILNKFKKIKVNSAIQDEPTWNQPRNEKITCRFDPLAAIQENQTTFGCSYLLDSVTNTHETFTMSLIGKLLVDGPNSPFYKSLIESEIGADYSPWTGHEGSFKRGFFSVGLREISSSDVDRVRDTIDSTIQDVIRDGFPKENIEGVLHNIELALKHQTTNFGHNAAMGINSSWNHGGNPIVSLKVNEHVNHFQQQLKQNPYFLQEKICQTLKDNPHKLYLQMSPDDQYEAGLQKAENNLLSSKMHSLTEEDKKNIYIRGLELAEIQEKQEDLSLLPTLHVSDIDRTTERTLFTIEHIDKVPVQLCEQPTNGIVYFRAFSKLSALSEDLLMHLPLFSEIVTKMGAGDHDFKSLDLKAELKTGGLSANVVLSDHHTNPEDFEIGVLFSSHCLDKNVEEMMKLWNDVFNRLRLEDKNRLTQLIKVFAADLAQSISSAGHKYGICQASSCLNLRESIKERVSGLSQVSFMKKLAECADCDEVLSKMDTLAKILLNKSNLRCCINSTPDSMSLSLEHVQHFIDSLSQNQSNAGTSEWPRSKFNSNKCHFVLPLNVNYVARSIMTVPFMHEDYASLKVAAKVMSAKFLHKEIREKGGAYGGGSSMKSSGTFIFYSYRDPHVTETLKSFDCGVEWLASGSFSNEDIDEAKLGIFSEIDQPAAPGVKGTSHFLSGITHEMKQQLRENLFAVKRNDVMTVAERYLCHVKSTGTAVIGPEHESTKSNIEWNIHCY